MAVSTLCLIEWTVSLPLDSLAGHRNPGVLRNEDGTILTRASWESRTERAGWSDGGKGPRSGSQRDFNSVLVAA